MSQGFHQWLAVLRTLVTSDTPGFVGGGIADVENTLGSLSHLVAQETALRDQVNQSEKVLGAAQRKYNAGYTDFLTVTYAERNLYTARDQLSDVGRTRLAASVALLKALGGG